VKATLILGALFVFGWMAWNAAFPRVEIRYRMTLEADVDGRPVRGSGVIEAGYSLQPRVSPEAGSLISGFRGEAVVLDLGARGMAFLLLRADRDPRYAPDSILLHAFGNGWFEAGAGRGEGFAWLRKLRGKAEVPLAKLPLLVRFRDLSDPKTIERVEPINLEASFGPGVRLTRATIEITDEPVTWAIDRKLPWLTHLDDHSLGGTRLQPVKIFADQLGASDFQWGKK
jgi:hypothetical protein